MALIVASSFFLNSCALSNSSNTMFTDNNKVADETFIQLIQAIESKDDSLIKADFSITAHSEQVNFDEMALKLVEFVQGEVISYTSAEESGVGAEYKKENGKMRKMIQSSFCVETTENKYYIAIKECVIDEKDNNNVGLMSIYIIEAKNWDEGYVYRGDGLQELGIHIVEQDEEDSTN